MVRRAGPGYGHGVFGSWTLAVGRDDFDRSVLADTPMPSLAEGEVLLRVDRVGVTANNITYAVLGESLRYWQFFPPEPRGLEAGWGVPPLWGFADVADSTIAGVPVGQRYYGYLPAASHLVVLPDRIDVSGFRDGSPHRAELPGAYNAYRVTTGDSVYRPEHEDLLVLFRPLFFTSYMLADYLIDQDFFGATTVVLSSASSKTAYATAFELRGQGPRVIGLTSVGNADFTRSLGCYDQVLTYDQVAAVDPAAETAYLDLSGVPETRAALREHLGDRLVQDLVVGLTNQDPEAATRPMFFAPDQMRKRATEWGRAGLDDRFAQAWRRFVEHAPAWVDIEVGQGAEALRAAWIEVLEGRAAPRVGHVIQL